MDAVLSHLDDAVARPGHGTFDEQQVPLRIDLVHGQPGLRMLCEPCGFGPRLKLCRLIVPAKPLPIPIPETLTLSPGSNVSTGTGSPTVSSVVPRNSTKCRCGPTFAVARCPRSAF